MFKEINGFTIDFNNRWVWGPTQGLMTWNQAKDSEENGWRLPTIFELRQAFIDKVPGFTECYYWSSSRDLFREDYMYRICSSEYSIQSRVKSFVYPVRYIKAFDLSMLKELGITLEML